MAKTREYYWQNDENASSCVGNFLYTLYQNQQLTDVTFIPKTGKISRSAHRVVLAAKCPFFKDLLFGKKKDKAIGMEMKVVISNMEFEVFCNILEYFYTDEIDFKDDSTVCEIYVGAREFQIQSLIARCESYIESVELTEDNVCSLFQMSETQNIERLKDRCIEYIQQSTDEVIGSTAFEKCLYSTIHTICNLHSINLSSETELLDAVARWIKAQPDHTKSQMTVPLLSCIRFLTFTAKELGDSIKKHPNLMTPEDALKLMMYLNGAADQKSLPPWCARNSNPRCLEQMYHKKYGQSLKSQTKEDSSKKVSIALKPSTEIQEIMDLTSSLEMTCLKGSHQIKAFTFCFKSPPRNGTVVVISLHILVQPREFFFNRQVMIRSKEMKCKLPREIYVWKGETVHIDTIINVINIQKCKLMELDRSNLLPNDDFRCIVESRNDLFCIREVEYGSLKVPHFFGGKQKGQKKKKNKSAHHGSTRSLASDQS